MLGQKVVGQPSSRKGFFRSSRGMSYVEVVVAMAIMSIIVVLIPTALFHTTKAMRHIEERTIAESLTRTQIEYLKSKGCEYKAVKLPPDGPGQEGNPGYITVPPPDDSYVIDIAVTAIDRQFYTPLLPDDGIQAITVTVKHIDRLLLTTVCYKVNR